MDNVEAGIRQVAGLFEQDQPSHQGGDERINEYPLPRPNATAPLYSAGQRERDHHWSRRSNAQRSDAVGAAEHV